MRKTVTFDIPLKIKTLMKMNACNTNLLNLIKQSLWEQGSAIVDENVYKEMKTHTLVALPATILSQLEMPEKLRQTWKTEIYKQIAYNVNYQLCQTQIPVTVPYVILKGTEAAKYYPHPQLRAMGDIDIITRHEDFDAAYQRFIELGYQIQKNYDREVGFYKDGILVELHRNFSKLNNVKHARYLDDLILSNINPSHQLPDRINGLVLLEHISQHLVNGLGLRQIIDWMMFVDKCLSDDEWPEFRVMTRNIGLENLALVATRMCEMYLGLPCRTWCQNVNEELCRQLMEYVLSCGNFGAKRQNDRSYTENVFVYSRNPIALFKLLQKMGMENWRAAQRFPILRPFAWLYQAFRYLRRGLLQRNALRTIKDAYEESRNRIKLFDALGVRQDSKGLVVYKNGEYVKE